MPSYPTRRPVTPRAGVAPTQRWCQWQSDPAAPIFPAHQYVREQASTTPDGPGGGLDDIRRRIASASAVMVGREVHALNAAIREQLSSMFKPWKRQEPGVKPQIRGWIVTPTG